MPHVPRPCGLRARGPQYDPLSRFIATGTIPCKSAISAAPACASRRRARLQQFRRAHRLEASRKVVDKALDLGITLFDTADTYRRRSAARRTFSARCSAPRRKDIVLATKFGKPMDERRHQRRRFAPLHHVRGRGQPQAAEDRLDRPLPAAPARSADADRGNPACARRPGPPGQGALHRLLQLPAWQVAEALWTSEHLGLAAVRCRARTNTACWCATERELMPATQAYGSGLLPFFPLASGLLTGKYRRNAPLPADARLPACSASRDRFLTDANWPIVEKLQDFAQARGQTCWSSPSAGWRAAAGRQRHRRRHQPEQVEQNVKAVDWTPAERAEMDRITKG